MPRVSAKAIAVTRHAFFAILVVLAVVALIGVVTWSFEPWRTLVVVVGFTTYMFAALFSVLLAGQRWPALGDFTQLHAWVVVAVIMGTAAAMLFYVAYPDPMMLLIGPFVLGFLVLMGWGIQKVHIFGF